MLLRRLPATCFALSLALLALAAFDYYRAQRPSRVTIDEPERGLQRVEAGKSLELPFVLRNPTAATARIVGLAEC